MFLLHLVLTGVFIGTLANNNDVYSAEADQSREYRKERKNKMMQLQNSNEVIKSDALADWIVRPRNKYKKYTRTQDISWLEGFSRRTTTEKIGPEIVKTTLPLIPSSYTTSTHVSPNNLDNWPSVVKQAVDKLAISVDNLSAVFKDLKTRKCSNFLKYANTQHNRRKRDVSDAKANISVEVQPVNDTKNTSAPDVGRASNDESSPAPELQNGRRSGHSFKSVKDKLLLYLDEGFQEIGAKVNSLRKTKQQFANVAPYKIGYIVANVDTLAVSIKNLREEARRNRQLWEEREILDVYDRLKISNSLISNLMDTLRLLMEDK